MEKIYKSVSEMIQIAKAQGVRPCRLRPVEGNFRRDPEGFDPALAQQMLGLPDDLACVEVIEDNFDRIEAAFRLINQKLMGLNNIAHMGDDFNEEMTMLLAGDFEGLKASADAEADIIRHAKNGVIEACEALRALVVTPTDKAFAQAMLKRFRISLSDCLVGHTLADICW